MGTRKDSLNPKLKSSYSHYISVRQKLDDLGYDHFLSNDSVALVDKLLSDLLHWKRNSAENKDAAEQWKKVSSELQKASTNRLRNATNTRLDNHYQQLEQMVLNEKKLNVKNVKDLMVENSKLVEEIEDMKIILAQNAEQIKKLNKENFSKSQIILQFESGIPESKSQNEHGKALGSQRLRPHIEKSYDLPHSNLSKIQSLYKQILSASEDPTVVDWVKSCEAKIKSMEGEIDNNNKVLQVTQNMCEDYQKKMVHYEKENGLLKSKINSAGIDQLKLKLGQMERENKNLQSQLSEAIGKQHEAMSRAIMLAGNRKSQNPAAPLPKSSGVQLLEKKVISLESELKALKQMLASTQKERDSFLKEINQLHSQEATLMTEIRSLTAELQQQQQTSDQRKIQNATDSGIESTESRDGGGDIGSKHDKWMKQLSEQRQRYYDNVQQLQACIRNRQPLTFQCECQHQPEPIRVNCATQTTENNSKPNNSSQTTVGDLREPATSEKDYMDSLPHQFQSWAQSLLEERKTLKEQNGLLKSNSARVNVELQNFEAKLNSSAEQLRQTERTRLKLENDLDNVNTKLLNAERELTQERAKNQQMRLDMDDADSIAASWNKKFSEKSLQLESNKKRCCELETQVFHLEEQIATLQGQLRSLQVHRSQKETENRQQLDEIDAGNARVKQLEKQLSMKQENLVLMQANIQSYESKIQRIEQESSKQQSQAELNQRQNQRLNEEIDQLKLNNTALRLENERLVSSMASLHVDLERERQGAENLQREVRSYVSRVQQVETMLAQKDEERTALLQQFQALTNESSNNESEREKMELTLRSHQQQASSLQKELSSVRRRLGEMEQLYTQQRSAGVEIEVQAEDLSCRMAVLERDLKESRDDKIRLEQQLLSANNLQQCLEKQLERLRMEAAQTDSQSHMRELEATRLQDEVQIIEQRLFKERESVRNLESVVSVLRQERVQQENQFRSLSLDFSRLQQSQSLLQEELANSKADLCSCEGKLSDLSNETQRLKQEVLQEKFEKEKTRQEFKKMASLCQTPPAISSTFNPSPTPEKGEPNSNFLVVGHCTSALSSAASTTQTTTSASTSSRRKLSVAERLSQNEI